MKYYFLAVLLILVGATLSLIVPILAGSANNILVSAETKIPQNNSAVLSLQKFNRPPVISNNPVPDFSARAILVKDLASGEILYQKNAQTPVAIASTTKIMTALISSDYFKQNQALTVKNSALTPGSKVGLSYGESLSFRSLLYGLLLNSGNDAAFAIAENYPGGVENFVETMNKKAKELNLLSTHFDNPAGFDSPNHFSSASDLAKISEEALKNTDLSRIFATKNTEVTSLDKKYRHELYNLNKLLSSLSGTLGIKTGYTEGAKENLVGLFERNGHKVLTIVLGSDDRFGETSKLVDWTYSNFTWID